MACRGCQLITHPLVGTAEELMERARAPMHRLDRAILLRAAEKAATDPRLKQELAIVRESCLKHRFKRPKVDN